MEYEERNPKIHLINRSNERKSCKVKESEMITSEKRGELHKLTCGDQKCHSEFANERIKPF